MAKPERAKSSSANLPPSFSSNSSKIHPANDPEGPPDPNSYSLEKFRLYETRAVSWINFFALGSQITQVSSINRFCCVDSLGPVLMFLRETVTQTV